ncbi:MBL fold metallo-hydrolase [Pseudomonas sp. NPDC090202]|uniref:MBL fold metallo-hydrolase n=1 Tax=unclassified Pseudomonas TaxID=196821 RepID=UPI0037F9E3D7
MHRIVLLLALLLAACTHEPTDEGLKVSDDHHLNEPKIQFLGVGGWLLHWHGESLLLAPSFSNPASLGIRGLPPLTVEANHSVIDRHMPDASDVRMLLVGHAHYDHLLDVSHVVRTKAPNAVVYGSETVRHILQAEAPDAVRTVVPRLAQISYRKQPGWRGTWFYSSGEYLTDGDDPKRLKNRIPKGRIRAMPVESMHAPHLFGRNFLPGAYDEDLTETPTSIFDWKLGHVTLAWVIDLLSDDGKPVYRIHYQDSAAEPPWGFPPLMADGRGYDVEILCAASWDKVSYYPTGLLRVTRPRMVLLGHWENFFGNDLDKPARTIPLQRYRGLVEKLAGYDAHVPEPFSEVQLPAPVP